MIWQTECAENLPGKACKIARQHIEDQVKEQTDKQGHQKSNNLIICNTTCIDANADVGATEQQQANIAAGHLANIQIANVGNGNRIR